MKLYRLPKIIKGIKGDQDTVELGAKTNANHACYNFLIFPANIFLFEAYKRIFFFIFFI